jgi:hypothetical protein
MPTSGIPRRDSSSSRNDRTDFDDNDAWPLQNCAPADSEQQPLQALSNTSRRSSSERTTLVPLGDEQQPAWASGAWARLPYLGLAALLGVLLRMFGLF